MVQSDVLIARLQADLNSLKHDSTENAEKIAALEKRVLGYDLLAAKWGGILMLAVALGTGVLTFWEKVKALAAWVGRQ